MEKLIVLLVVVFTSLTIFAGSGLAEGKRKTLNYSGIVDDVDPQAGTIVVGKTGKSLGMLFNASSAVFFKVNGLKDLKPGDKVIVEYDARLGQTVAVSITRE